MSIKPREALFELEFEEKLLQFVEREPALELLSQLAPNSTRRRKPLQDCKSARVDPTDPRV